VGDKATQRFDPTREVKRCLDCGQRFGADALFCPFCGVKLEVTTWDASSDPLLGTIIDERYEVLGVLGEGGMGVVYKVRHVSLDRMFALKALRADLARDTDLATRFVNEAKATAALKHPGIVQITDFGKLAGGVPYFVMELLVGRTLASALRAGPMKPAVAIEIAMKVAEALEGAHEHQVVHRDLKPENIFLVGQTGGDAAPSDVKIVDFGAAKVLGSAKITKTGIVFGTPHYMSPEQAAGHPIDHRVDIYALGIIMYEMITGRVPFEADTYLGVLTQHIFVQPVPPSEVVPNLTNIGPFEELVLRALEKKPEERFTTMAELAAELRGLHKLGEAARSDAPPRKRSKRPPVYHKAVARELPDANAMAAAAVPGDRPTWRTAAVAAAFAALASVTVVLVWRQSSTGSTPARPPPEPPVVVVSASTPPAGSAPALATPAPIQSATAATIATSTAPPSAASTPIAKKPAASASSRAPAPAPPPKPTSNDDFADPWGKKR
jgi:serine/threonine-protein kinase